MQPLQLPCTCDAQPEVEHVAHSTTGCLLHEQVVIMYIRLKVDFLVNINNKWQIV